MWTRDCERFDLSASPAVHHRIRQYRSGPSGPAWGPSAGAEDVGVSTRDQLLSQSSVRLRVVALEAARADVHQSFSAPQASGQPRGEGPAWQSWLDATSRFRKALDAIYPALWQNLRDRLSSGDPEAVEVAVVFLEADPMCFRSGYDKDTLMRRLSHLDLPEKTRHRLRNVVVQTWS
jgi:hypothetical protein